MKGRLCSYGLEVTQWIDVAHLITLMQDQGFPLMWTPAYLHANILETYTVIPEPVCQIFKGWNLKKWLVNKLPWWPLCTLTLRTFSLSARCLPFYVLPAASESGGGYLGHLISTKHD